MLWLVDLNPGDQPIMSLPDRNTPVQSVMRATRIAEIIVDYAANVCQALILQTPDWGREHVNMTHTNINKRNLLAAGRMDIHLLWYIFQPIFDNILTNWILFCSLLPSS